MISLIEGGIPIKALLSRVLPDVIVWAELESEVALVVRGDIQHYWNY